MGYIMYKHLLNNVFESKKKEQKVRKSNFIKLKDLLKKYKEGRKLQKKSQDRDVTPGVLGKKSTNWLAGR